MFTTAFLNGVPLVELTLRPDLSSNCDIRTHARSCCCCFLCIVYTQASFVLLVLAIRFALSFRCDTPTHACARARTHAHTHTHTRTHARTHTYDVRCLVGSYGIKFCRHSHCEVFFKFVLMAGEVVSKFSFTCCNIINNSYQCKITLYKIMKENTAGFDHATEAPRQNESCMVTSQQNPPPQDSFQLSAF